MMLQVKAIRLYYYRNTKQIQRPSWMHLCSYEYHDGYSLDEEQNGRPSLYSMEAYYYQCIWFITELLTAYSLLQWCVLQKKQSAIFSSLYKV